MMTIRFCGAKTQEPLDTGFCEPNLNLLAHAQAIELEIGSRCGGHGVCGGDRVRIPEGSRDLFSPLTEREREHLTKGEIADGWRLACQCFPDQSHLQIDIDFR